MKRLLLVAGYLGYWGETDGVVTTYRSLIPYLKASGNEIDLLAYGPEDSIEYHGPLRVIQHRPRVPVKIDPARWVDPVISLTRPGRLLAKKTYDLVQCSTPDPAGWFAMGISRRSNCPFVAVYHTALEDYARIRYRRLAGRLAGSLAGAVMSRWVFHFYNRADLVLAPSKCVRDELADRLSPPVRVLSRGVDTRLFHPAHRTRTDQQVRALYVGRVAPEKNLALLVALFRNRKDAHLTVVGDGPYMKTMQQKLPQARFTGRLTGRALAQVYADSDLFVFPSLTDTLGNVVLEAMSSGLPVIVTGSMGPRELVDDGRTGFIAQSDTEFEQALDRLVGISPLRTEMGRQAREAASLRRWSDVADRMLSLHDEAIRTYRDRANPAGSAVAGKSLTP
jgi:glycosyltransferase involved in cell wall biosynthesis